MLLNIEKNYNNFILSYFDNNGYVKLKTYPFKDLHSWEITTHRDYEKDEKYKNINGEFVRKKEVKTLNKFGVFEFIKNLPIEEQNEIFSTCLPKIYFGDIETEITKESSRNVEEYTKQAINKVKAISIVTPDNTIDLFCYKEITKEKLEKLESKVNKYVKKVTENTYKINLHCFNDEFDMLNYFFTSYMINIPLLTGWNFTSFDWSYLTNRAINLNIDISKASPTGKLEKINISTNIFKGKNKSGKRQLLTPMHVGIMDYLEIVKKWDRKIKIKENMSLDYISEAVLGIKKIKYDGSLDELYESNFIHYIFYNIIDAILVQLIHNKIKTINIPLTLASICKIPIYKNDSAVAITENLIFDKLLDSNLVLTEDIFEKEKIKRLYTINEKCLNDLKKKLEPQTFIKLLKIKDQIVKTETDFIKLIETVLNKNEIKQYLELIIKKSGTKYQGAYVKDPITGKHYWVACFDFASLYPTTMRQFNISPESFIEKILNINERRKNGDIVCFNGSVFQKNDSILKQIISTLDIKRKDEKKKMFEYHNKSVQIEKSINLLKEKLKNYE